LLASYHIFRLSSISSFQLFAFIDSLARRYHLSYNLLRKYSQTVKIKQIVRFGQGNLHPSYLVEPALGRNFALMGCMVIAELVADRGYLYFACFIVE